MSEKRFGAEFLQKKDQKIHVSPPVESAVRRAKKRGKEVPEQKDKAGRVDTYLSRLEEVFTSGDEKKIERRVEKFKEILHKEAIIKEENIPDSYFKLQQRIAREQGHGDIQISPEIRQQMTDTVIRDQEDSFDSWIDYMSSNDATYPTWYKYWVGKSIARLGTYDKAKKTFRKRRKDTTDRFPDIDREAVAYVYDELHKSLTEKGEVPIEEQPNEELQKLLKGADFAKLYAYAIEKVTPADQELKEQIEGVWVTYELGTDHKPLYESLQGQGTGWCTAGERTAEIQLKTGDFHVYYTNDKSGKPTVPRIAVRMEDEQIAEIRGVSAHQELEPILMDVAKERMNSLPGGDKYEKKTRDMKRLTEIEKKLQAGGDLTRDELRFFYEVDEEIEGFGYEQDPRIEQITTQRWHELKKDMQIIFDETEDAALASKMIRSGAGWVLLNKDKLDSFEGLDHKKFVLEWIELGLPDSHTAKWVLSVFDDIDKEIALKLINTGQEKAVVDNLIQFKGLNQGVALKLTEVVEGWDVARNLDKFEGLDQKLAMKLIEAGKGWDVARNIDKFEGLDHKEIAMKLIEAGKGWDVARNIDKFEGLDHKEIAMKLIEAGEGKGVAQNLYKFEGLDQEFAMRLIDMRYKGVVAANLDKFERLDQKLAMKLIEAGEGFYVIRNLDKFEGLDHKEIAMKLIEAGKGFYVIRNLDKFEGLDHKEIAMKLIEAGEGKGVAQNLHKFEGLDHKEIAMKLVEAGEGFYVIRNLDKFEGLDHKEIAMKLIEAGEGFYVRLNLDKFEGLDHKEIAMKLIEAGEDAEVAHNIDKFEGLDREVAMKLIKAGYGRFVKSSLESFGEDAEYIKKELLK